MSDEKRIAISIDDWKKSKFEKGLRDAGFEKFETKPLTKDRKVLVIFVTISADRILELARVVAKLNNESRRECN